MSRLDPESLDNYLYQIVPEMLGTLQGSIDELKPAAIKVLETVRECFHFKEHLSTIIHTLIKILDQCEYPG